MPDDVIGMRLALAEAERAYALGEIPIGAVILNDAGEVIASGYNLRETEHDATAHAELIAIRRACQVLDRWRLTGLTLYVTIEPCPMCAGAIVMSRISRVVYGGTDAKAGACESLFNITGCPALNHQPEMRAGVLEDECSAIIKQFFQERRKNRVAHI
ncbi:tRNA adenosine(34) deaminase TadA [uncultured Selenomonas sp.]|uniref:tRNA adenosine(34) deaminase TadA n=1 Tax=uncultured Selenomonas sp. TaxID=159275 RepID=UPI0028EACCB9|nr:tRNA adenosine(34) deaminase TadA [uncultured Selenomonas sp.]